MATVYGHTDLKIGVLVEIEGAPYRVTDYSHHAMGRGGAVVQVKLKNLLTGGVVEKSFRGSDKIQPADVSRANMQMFNGRVIGLEIPNAVVLTVTETEPGAKGDTATTALKPATLETGAQVMVPLFVNEGDRVKVNTLSGSYLARA